MSSSTGSGDVVGERAWWSAEAVVGADRCGEGEEACADACSEAVAGVGAVAFEGEQVFAGLEDRLDPLPDRREVGPAAAFVFAVWADDRRVEVGRGALELAAGVALVADHEEVAVASAALDFLLASSFFSVDSDFLLAGSEPRCSDTVTVTASLLWES